MKYLILLFTILSLASYSQTNCNNATLINFPGVYTNTTCGNGNNYTISNACVVNIPGTQIYGQQDYLYQFSVNQPGIVSLVINNIISSGFGSINITVFDGCPFNGGICVMYNSYTTMNVGNHFLDVYPGNTYYVLIDGTTNSFGNNISCYGFTLTTNFINFPANIDCNNISFENNNLNGWLSYRTRILTGIPSSNIPISTAVLATSNSPDFLIMTNSINACSGLNVINPLFGTRSLRLGDVSMGGRGSSIYRRQSININNSNLKYAFMLVFEDGGHNLNEQPFFKASIKDINGNVIQCTEFSVAANSSSGFITSSTCSGWVYRNWQIMNVNLSPYIGQDVIIEFESGDCSQAGHAGYAFIDLTCEPSTLLSNYTICAGECITLNPPIGYTNINYVNGGPIVCPVSNTTYTITGRNSNNCLSLFEVDVNVINNNNSNLNSN